MKVCADHDTPFTMFADAFFNESFKGGIDTAFRLPRLASVRRQDVSAGTSGLRQDDPTWSGVPHPGRIEGSDGGHALPQKLASQTQERVLHFFGRVGVASVL